MSTDLNPTPPANPETPPAGEPDPTFSQADVDRIVAERLKRERDATKTKYADYEDLKAKAGEATTLEDRVKAIEQQATDSEARAMRAEVANAKGLSTTQAKRLVGSTRDELEADADELLSDIGAQRAAGNQSPPEGQPPNNSGGGEERDFVRGLFGAKE